MARPLRLELAGGVNHVTSRGDRREDIYVNFVREGVGLPSIWNKVQNQVFLSSEKFVNKNQTLIGKKESLGEVPRLQQRKIPRSLDYYDSKCKDQKKAIINAYLSGGYTLRELSDYFGRHYSTISRIVNK